VALSADLHDPASQSPAERMLPGAEQARQLGAAGTPEVLEFAPAELAAQLETSYGPGRSLMADALDLRHQLPELWQLIVTAGVPSWKARKVAQATRHASATRHDSAADPSPADSGRPQRQLTWATQSCLDRSLRKTAGSRSSGLPSAALVWASASASLCRIRAR
jgi:hypothetical protein